MASFMETNWIPNSLPKAYVGGVIGGRMKEAMGKAITSHLHTNTIAARCHVAIRWRRAHNLSNK
jgi:hypothetical protein